MSIQTVHNEKGKPSSDKENLLEINNLKTYYPVKGGFF